MDLFDPSSSAPHVPLAARVRPRSFDEIVGQEHLVGPRGPLREAVLAGNVPSIILYGPAGSGKSTIARVIASVSGRQFIEFSATSSGVAEIRAAAERALNDRRMYDRGTIVFCDEIHRMNKAQQDAFLPHVENGIFTLIGATTENPYFEVNSPLLSRCTIARLNPLSEEHIAAVLDRAMTDSERGIGALRIELTPEAREHIVAAANGDARRALNALEQAAYLCRSRSDGAAKVDLAVAREATQQRLLLYDREGQQHYDVISAYIKSIRGSDPDAAVFWLAYMLEAGEDPRFVARRMVIAAAEDIGNADPLGLVLAVAAAQAVELVGMPEAQIPLAQATVYLACAEKSNRSYEAIAAASAAVREAQRVQVPPHLMDVRHERQKREGLGVGYVYPHSQPGAFVVQEYLPEALRDSRFYFPSERGREARMAERLARLWGLRYRGGDSEES